MNKCFIVAAACALGAVAYHHRTSVPNPAPVAAFGATRAPQPGENQQLRTNNDAPEIFRRAFWREPTVEEKILHAERREWVGETGGVRRWQWFLAVRPGTAFSTWLRESKPFRLAKVESGSFPFFERLPDWFPAVVDLARYHVQQSPDGGITVIFDFKKNVLYATGAGRGFGVTEQPSPPDTRVPNADANRQPLTWAPRR